MAYRPEMTRSARLWCAAALCLLTASAAATTYRWTDPKTSRTVLSNQPPPAGIAVQGKRPSDTVTNPTDSLPYAVRQVAAKFPVSLYLIADCPSCEQGRQLLIARGVPFTQFDANTPDAQQTLKTLTGKNSVPVLLVGKQSSEGFEAGRWNRLLDLAGYPATAAPGYRAPAELPKPDPATAPESAAPDSATTGSAPAPAGSR